MFSGFSRRVNASVFGALAAVVSIGLVQNGWAQTPAETNFTTYCGACHSIGEGLRVGPDLAGIHERRSQDWLEQFVKSSQSLIKSGDAEAIAIAAEFNGIIMPDALISEQQIREVLSYIAVRSAGLASAGGESTTVATQPAPVAAPASEEEMRPIGRGRS